MEKPALSVCLIHRDDPLIEKCVARFRDPELAKQIDIELCIVDTGSDDDSKVRLLPDRFERFEGCNDEEGRMLRFDLARQKSFALATKPWVMWADTDDDVVGLEKLPAILAEFARLKLPNHELFVPFRYEYAYDGDGQCILLQYRERVFSNPTRGFRWVNWVHEVAIPREDVPVQLLGPSDEIVWKHQRQYSPKYGKDFVRSAKQLANDENRNLRILRRWVKECGDSDARTVYYLGLECLNAGQVDEGLVHLDRYVGMSGWEDERFMACARAFETCVNLDVDAEPTGVWLKRAILWAYRAIDAREDWAEGYLMLARAYYLTAIKEERRGGPHVYRFWQRCVHFGQIGLALPQTRTTLFVNPLDREFNIHVFLNMALIRLNRNAEALESCQAALARREDRNLRYNSLLVREYVAREKAIAGLFELRDVAGELRNRGMRHGGMTPEVSALAEELIRSPDAIDLEKKRRELKALALGGAKPASSVVATDTSKLRIAIAAGGAWEEWDPTIIEAKGMGGSEIAAAAMARELAKRGYAVTVYAPCKDAVHEGVAYRPFETMANEQERCDVLVASRYAHMLREGWNPGSRSVPAETARARILWVHDVYACVWDQCGPDILLKADVIFALSEWHRGFLIDHHKRVGHAIDEGRVRVTRNGIDTEAWLGEHERRVDQGLRKDAHAAVCSSSPDRYLDALLPMWPRIRARVPDATLHVMYGFDNWDKSAVGHPDVIVRIARLKGELDALEDQGVFFHGRVGPAKLRRRYCASGVWLYPTWFTETSCISAMEAQMAGLFAVTSPIAALNETLGPRGTLVSGDWLAADYQNLFVDAAVGAMTGTIARPEDRTKLMKYAVENFSWKGVADQWEKTFAELLGGIEKPTTVDDEFPAYEAT